MLELGPIEQNIAKQAARAGQPLPDRIANAPELKFGLGFYLQAFFDLDAERSQGWGTGRIPWVAVVAYGTYYECDEEQLECLLHFIRAMDSAHLKRLENDRPKPKGA